MKKCSYCGAQNPDDSLCCSGCGLELEAEPDPARTSKLRRIPKPDVGPRASSDLLSAGFFESADPLDLSSVEMGYSFEDGFSRPDWKLIGENVRKLFPQEKWPQVWREVGIKWLCQLRDDLGGDYQQHESWNYLLLSAESKDKSEAMLKTAEFSIQSIESVLGSANMGRKLFGKRVILAFSEADDYYTYISHYYPEGSHALSAGVFLSKDYGHIALQYTNFNLVNQIITHEVTHNYLWGLPIPLWLNEGLSQRMEQAVHIVGGRTQSLLLTPELAQEHRAYWNEQNIQEFWAGVSFYRPDEVNRLSYNLGEILVQLLSEQWSDLLDFIRSADFHDGGQDAALKCFGRSLGDVVGEFLGPGDWRPNRKIIAECHERRKKAKTADDSN